MDQQDINADNAAKTNNSKGVNPVVAVFAFMAGVLLLVFLVTLSGSERESRATASQGSSDKLEENEIRLGPGLYSSEALSLFLNNQHEYWGGGCMAITGQGQSPCGTRLSGNLSVRGNVRIKNCRVVLYDDDAIEAKNIGVSFVDCTFQHRRLNIP